MSCSDPCGTKCDVMHISQRGVAYDFWLQVERARVAREWSKSELAERAGIPRKTIDNLEVSRRAPQVRIVNALADALEIDRDEAACLATLLPADAATVDPSEDVRGAIRRSTAYTEEQRAMLLSMVDLIETANRTTRHPGVRRGRGVI
jgi:transcriptional regulator with XRE-family HTH domain